MKFTHLSLLSIGTLLVLNGCHERGTIVPPSHPDYKKQQKKIYNFPVLKVSAKPDKLEPVAQIPQKKDVNIFDLSYWIDSDKKEKVTQNIVKKETSTVTPSPVIKKEPALPKIQTKKVVHKRKKKKNTELKNISIFGDMFKGDLSFQDIPIINKIIPEPSKRSKNRVKKVANKRKSLPKRFPETQKDTSTSIENTAQRSNKTRSTKTVTSTGTSFSGGSNVSGLDMAKIRIETDSYQTNIILDSYKWNGYNRIPSEESDTSGSYFFKYQPYSNKIIAHIKGYKGFSALVRKQNELLKNNPMIKDIYIDRYVGTDGIKFIIELKAKAKVNIIDIEDPASIIIELYPLKK